VSRSPSDRGRREERDGVGAGPDGRDRSGPSPSRVPFGGVARRPPPRRPRDRPALRRVVPERARGPQALPEGHGVGHRGAMPARYRGGGPEDAAARGGGRPDVRHGGRGPCGGEAPLRTSGADHRLDRSGDRRRPPEREAPVREGRLLEGPPRDRRWLLRVENGARPAQRPAPASAAVVGPGRTPDRLRPATGSRNRGHGSLRPPGGAPGPRALESPGRPRQRPVQIRVAPPRGVERGKVRTGVFGMRGDLEILVAEGTGLPVAIRGRAPGIGHVTVRLRRAELDGAPPEESP